MICASLHLIISIGTISDQVVFFQEDRLLILFILVNSAFIYSVLFLNQLEFGLINGVFELIPLLDR